MSLDLRLATAATAAAMGLLLTPAAALAGLAALPLGQAEGQGQRAIASTPGPLPLLAEVTSQANQAPAPCIPGQKPGQQTVMMQSWASLAQAGSDAPAAQAAVLVSGLVVLVSAGLLLKQQTP